MASLDMSDLPPGFGFHPTDVELVMHYLKRKRMGIKEDNNVIPEIDIYKYEPWDLPDKSGVPFKDCKWHFFNVRDRKYPNGLRSNRATEKGYWKSTGKDRIIRSGNRGVGTKKTLVFHEGRPPMGRRTEWIMHEYYSEEKSSKEDCLPKDAVVLCRVTKRNGFMAGDEEARPPVELENSNDSSITQPLESTPGTSRDAAKLTVRKVEPTSLSEEENYADWIEELTHSPNSADIFSGPDAMPNFDTLQWDSYVVGDQDASFLTGGDLTIDYLPDSWPKFDDIDFSSAFEIDPSAKMAPMAPADRLNNNENMPQESTGIVIRHREVSDFTGKEGQRIRLQVHKMESRNPGVTSHTVMLDTSDHRLDSSGPKMVPPHENKCEDRAVKAEAILEEPVVRNYEETEGVAGNSASRRSMQQGGVYQCPPCATQNDDSRSWRGVRTSLRGAFREARLLVRSCSVFGARCMVMGTCLVGVVAMCGCLHQEDA